MISGAIPVPSSPLFSPRMMCVMLAQILVGALEESTQHVIKTTEAKGKLARPVVRTRLQWVRVGSAGSRSGLSGGPTGRQFHRCGCGLVRRRFCSAALDGRVVLQAPLNRFLLQNLSAHSEK